MGPDPGIYIILLEISCFEYHSHHKRNGRDKPLFSGVHLLIVEMGQTYEEIQEKQKITQLTNNMEKNRIIYLTDKEKASKVIVRKEFFGHCFQIEDIKNCFHGHILIH